MYILQVPAKELHYHLTRAYELGEKRLKEERMADRILALVRMSDRRLLPVRCGL